MHAEENVQQLSEIPFLLRAGGNYLLFLGVVLALWGLVNVLIPRMRALILMQSLLSLLPGLLAMMAIYSACTELAVLAASPTLPKPADLAQLAGYAMSCGFWGLAGTMVPMTLGLLALWRAGGPSDLDVLSTADNELVS